MAPEPRLVPRRAQKKSQKYLHISFPSVIFAPVAGRNKVMCSLFCPPSSRLQGSLTYFTPSLSLLRFVRFNCFFLFIKLLKTKKNENCLSCISRHSRN